MVALRDRKSSLRVCLGILSLMLGLNQMFIFNTSFKSFQAVPQLLNKSGFLVDLDDKSGAFFRNRLIIENASSKVEPTQMFKSKQFDSNLLLLNSSITIDAEALDDPFMNQPVANASIRKEAKKLLKPKQLHTSVTREDVLRKPRSANNSEPMNHFDWNQSFSACLLFMDDHNRLSEWIAYHYFALPLGYLIIAVDPASKDPPRIDAYWKTVMKIELWDDKDFMPIPGQIQRREKDDPKQIKDKHRRRQRRFYKECGRHLRDNGRTLTTFHDTDEYITVSDHFQANFSTTVVHKPGFVRNLIHTYRQEQSQVQRQKENKNASLSWIHKYYTNTCFHVPRTLYTAVESTAAERNRSLPEWINALQFTTFRYRYHLTPYEDREPNQSLNGLAKAIVDVSKLTDSDLGARSTAHSPFKPACLRTSPNIDYGLMPLGIHHYLGSWESYSREKDPRKDQKEESKKKWERFAYSKAGGADDEIRPWIRGFLEMMDTETARYLLRNAGLPLKNQTK